MNSRLFAATALALTLAACRDTAAPAVSNGTLAVTIESTGLRLANSGDEKVYYLAVNASVVNIAAWTLCRDPVTCPGVEAHGTRLVTWADVCFENVMCSAIFLRITDIFSTRSSIVATVCGGVNRMIFSCC